MELSLNFYSSARSRESSNFLDLFPKQLAEMRLYVATTNGDSQKIEELIKTYPDLLNKRLDQERTLLHFAAEEGTIEAIFCLKELGADLQAKDLDGKTPQMAAADSNNHDTEALLGIQSCYKLFWNRQLGRK